MSSPLRSAFLRHVAQTSPEPDGLEISHGEGIYLMDTSGKRYIDCISGIAVSSMGHGHPEIQAAIQVQLNLHLHTMVYGEHIQAPQVALASRLADYLPPPLDCTFFTNSGTEAVEGALKLARKYTSRYEIVACRNAYHGSSAGAESLRSDLEYTAASRPLVPGIRHILFNTLDDLQHITSKTAAVILEPVQGEAGVMLPLPGYLRAVRARCDETGTMLIFDSIQCGMGRTGSLFGFEPEDVIPDILLLAKAFGGGMPLGAFIAAKEIMTVLSQKPILGHLTTFGGHPLSCAAGLAALAVLMRDDLLHRVSDREQQIRSALKDHPAILEIRGRGLMLAIELRHPAQRVSAIQYCRKEGLLVDWFLFNNQSIRLYPPLIITETETTLLCEALTRGLQHII